MEGTHTNKKKGKEKERKSMSTKALELFSSENYCRAMLYTNHPLEFFSFVIKHIKNYGKLIDTALFISLLFLEQRKKTKKYIYF